MVLSKKKYLPETFTFGDIPLQASKSINYLGFVISYNGKYRSITHDRIMKATRMPNMVLQAIRTKRNVSVRLALSLFDKQITPILLYGCPVWSLPDSQNLIYFVNQPECTNIRNLVSEAIFDKLGRHISFAYARRVGRKIPNTNSCILIRLKDYDDNVKLLTCTNSPYNFDNFVVNYDNSIEKVHTSFMKRTLNISKYAGNKILYGELARFPLLHNTWALGVKYWLVAFMQWD